MQPKTNIVATDKTDDSSEPIFVARQPVFDQNMRIWGYELLFRDSAQSAVARIDDGNVATSRVISDGFSLAQEWLKPGQRVLINYPAPMLTQGAALALPPSVAVVEILETVLPEAEILAICAQLKEEGYILALDDFVGDPGFEPLLELADLVKVDVLQLSPDRLAEVVQGIKLFSVELLAEKVEDLAMFDLCRDLGFSLFQGYFFSRPQTMTGRKLSANQISKLKLLENLNAPDLDLGQIAKIVQTDVSLSYRLLRYINSAGVGLRYEVTSIAQAVNLLGQRKVAAWLRVLIMSDMNSTPRAAELLFFCLQRARFLELLSTNHSSPPQGPDAMFLLGLFSCLDALLDQPMTEIVAKIALEERLAKALLGSDPELGVWLSLAVDSERGEWERAGAALDALDIDHRHAAQMHNIAGVLARKFLDMA